MIGGFDKDKVAPVGVQEDEDPVLGMILESILDFNEGELIEEI